MKVLIVYGTTEGQTRKIAEWTATRLREQGHDVDVRDSAALLSDLDLGSFAACLVAGSVHHGHHQKTVADFVLAHREFLRTTPSALISVSLSAVLQDESPDAQGYVDEFVASTGWTPRETLLLGGAARFTEYDYFQEQVVKFIVMRRGELDGGEQDREFTDWAALGRFVDSFVSG